MRDAFSQIKYYVSFAETCLKRANKQWAYYKNGHPISGETQPHFFKSQKSYENAKKFAAKALELLKVTPNNDLEKRAKIIINNCNKK
ncbi:MAG: hypothetical protein MSL09_05380 [Spirochaetia bacterium]|nr:hypothetical protein [Spirochaetia bacterium]